MTNFSKSIRLFDGTGMFSTPNLNTWLVRENFEISRGKRFFLHQASESSSLVALGSLLVVFPLINEYGNFDVSFLENIENDVEG